MPDANAKRLAAVVAINTRWAKSTPSERSKQGQAMRAGKRAKAIAAIDPEGKLEPDQLERQLQQAQTAEMAKITLASLRQRKGRKGGTAQS